MMCDRCGTTIRGEADTFAPETGSGVAATVVMCKGGCRPDDRQRYPVEPIVLTPQDPRYRPRRRLRR